MTHRPVEAAFAKERPGSGGRDGFAKDLDCEHREGNMGLIGGQLWEPDHSAESSPENVKKSQTSRAGIILYIIAVNSSYYEINY
ncbi:hypothetical protein Zmor_005792 [Zophobas morio]|uniref:Uncharacterized protein n=1 Tax=Zophobas morio TaxID=2755281 RepID=A0AA38ITJ5_9CUCU|nr:hypothetical protein Zmor_005792 [Zophobas morio]